MEVFNNKEQRSTFTFDSSAGFTVVIFHSQTNEIMPRRKFEMNCLTVV